MTKKELIKQVAGDCNLTQMESQALVQSVMDRLMETLCEGKSIRLVGFGAFQVKIRKARKGRHPKTGEELMLPEHKTVTFSPGKTILDRINKGVNS